MKSPILSLLLLASAAGAQAVTTPVAPARVAPAVQNFLLIVSDDLRANAIGAYGNTTCRTPNIDRLAQRGMVFERAYCQGTVCGPSRTSFMFSRYTGTGSVNLGQHLKNQGFYTARAGKIYHMAVPRDIIAGSNGQDIASSWTERFNSQGQEVHTPGDYACLSLDIFTTSLVGRQTSGMPHRYFTTVSYTGDGSDQPDHKTATKIIDLMRAHRQRGKPFFLAAGFIRPHYPMVAPKQFFAPYPWQQMQMPPQIPNDIADIPSLGRTSMSSQNGLGNYPNNQLRVWEAYFATVTFMDEQVGRILNELDRLGLRDTTAVVFISDHGYHLGDHTFWQKNNLHEQVARVPLIVSVPGFPSGRTQSIVELVDVFPTVTELVGVPRPNGLHGTSLVPVLRDARVTVKQGALSIAKGYSWRVPDWAYMRYTDKTEELYDMRGDPHQLTNLAGNSGFEATRRKLEAELDAKLRSVGL